MPDTNAQIQSHIRSFIAELHVLIRHAAIDAVGSALGAAPAKRGPGRPPKTVHAVTPSARPSGAPARKASARGKRPAAELARTVDALLAHIRSHPGERIEQIAVHLKLKTKQLALPTQKLLAAKRITKKGAKRATTYFPAKA